MKPESADVPLKFRDGRRSFLLLLPIAIAPSLGTLSALWFWPGSFGSSIYAVCKAVLYGLPFIFWLTMPRGQRPKLRCSRASLAAGLVSGVAIGGLIIGLWHLALASSTDASPLIAVVRENGLDDSIKFWLFAAWLCIGNSFLEEFVFRWFVDSRLQITGLKWKFVVPVSASIFTLHHVFVLSAYFDVTLTVLGSLGVFSGGVLWSVLRLKSSSLTPGWLSHAIVDLAIILVGASILGLWPHG